MEPPAKHYGQIVISRTRCNLEITSREDRALIRSKLNEGAVADKYRGMLADTFRQDINPINSKHREREVYIGSI